MGSHFQTGEMEGEKPFRCYNCNKQLLVNINGSDYTIDLTCPRCKAKITMELRNPIPEELAVKQGSLVKPLSKQ